MFFLQIYLLGHIRCHKGVILRISFLFLVSIQFLINHKVPRGALATADHVQFVSVHNTQQLLPHILLFRSNFAYLIISFAIQ